MEISIVQLLGLAFFALYLWYEYNDNNKPKKPPNPPNPPIPPQPPIIIHQTPIIIQQPVTTPVQQPPQRQPQRFLPAATQFVKVIFRPDDDKSYDYLLGNHHNIKVGDFVKVWTSQGKNKTVQVVYISGYGEVSAYAKTVINGKTRRPQWWH